MVDGKLISANEKCKTSCVKASMVQDEGTPNAARAPLASMGVYAVGALCIVAALLLQ